jgi:hypothetical protein
LEEAESFLRISFMILNLILFAWLKRWEMVFPIGGILIAPHFKTSFGLLRTTFWWKSACAANVQFSM